MQFVERIRQNRVLRVLRKVGQFVWKYLTYCSKQSRFDRFLQKTALTPASIAKSKKELAAYWEAKRNSGRLRIHQVGEIDAGVPFPVKGSLLTDSERADLGRVVVPVREDK